MTDAGHSVALAASEAYPRIVATLIRITRDWTLAEDSAQEAMAKALKHWPQDGVPANPAGWLMRVARNHALDVLRRATVERRTLREVAVLELAAAGDALMDATGREDITDDRLRLIFTACHPALSPEARVALTLRTVCGVPTVDIARALLVTESTMTRRLTRAKGKIIDAGIPFRVPSGALLAERLPGVLTVLYLLFTTGYNTDGTPAFAEEAIRLARLLADLLPQESEPAALLALMLLQHSRRDARQDGQGRLIDLHRQDRSRWDRSAISEARRILAAGDAATVSGPDPGPGNPLTDSPTTAADVGPYGLQARIAACHAEAPSVDATDWPRIASHYDLLAAQHHNPVVELNRAVAHGYAHGPDAGLDLLARLRRSGDLGEHPLLLAAEADLTGRAGRRGQAADLFRRAAAQTHSSTERRALLDRADEQSAPARQR